MRIAVLGIAAAVALGAVLAVLSGSDQHRSGTNNVPAAGEVAQLERGERRCQAADVPASTDQLAVAAVSGSGAVPALAVTLGSGPRPLASGRTRGIAPDGRPLADLQPAPPDGQLRVCVRNADDDVVALQGVSGTFGVDYYDGTQSWWEAAPAVAQRFGLGKTGFMGAWTFWLATALVAGALIAGWRALAEAGRTA